MADIECPQCGRRALGVATRCPHCGHGFPPHLLQHPAAASESRWLRPLLVLVVALVAVAVMVVTGRRGTGSRETTVPPAASPADTAPSIPAQLGGEAARPAGDSAPPVAPPPPEQPPPAGPMLRRYAKTWVNVRSGRTAGASAIRILGPGDTVLVDSLRRGWYRVVVNGRTLGYVARPYLDTVPPLDRP